MLAKLKDVAERVLSTFLSTVVGLFVAMVIANGIQGVNLDAAEVWAVAGVAAALSVLKNAITELLGIANGGKSWQDAAERVLFTYAQVFLGLMLINGTVDFGNWKNALLSAFPAAFNVLKTVLAQHYTGLAGFWAAPTAVAPVVDGAHQVTDLPPTDQTTKG